MSEEAQAAQEGCVLIVQRSSALDGSAHSGLLLADGLHEAGWDTHVAFGFEGPIIERYAAAGHETHVIPHDNWLRRDRIHQFAKDIYLEWRKATAFQSLIEKIGADAVYLNTVVSLAGAVATSRADVPCVWHLREMWADVGGEMRAPRWAIPLVRWTIRFLSDRRVANSQATARNLMDDRGDDVTIVPNAVRTAFFEEDRSMEEARAMFDLPSGASVIGMPGTLRPMKGHPFFFDAVAPVLRERGEVQVVVTGGGSANFITQLKEKIRNLGIQNCVSFLGWVEDMPAFYRACDLVCIPSRAEPFGRTAIEAFAVGTPVVASSVGGLQEIVTGEETGVLVSYGHEEGFAEAVHHLLEAPDVRQKMSANARQVAEEKYHQQVYKRRITQLVEGVSSV